MCDCGIEVYERKILFCDAYNGEEDGRVGSSGAVDWPVIVETVELGFREAGFPVPGFVLNMLHVSVIILFLGLIVRR